MTIFINKSGLFPEKIKGSGVSFGLSKDFTYTVHNVSVPNTEPSVMFSYVEIVVTNTLQLYNTDYQLGSYNHDIYIPNKKWTLEYDDIVTTIVLPNTFSDKEVVLKKRIYKPCQSLHTLRGTTNQRSLGRGGIGIPGTKYYYGKHVDDAVYTDGFGEFTLYQTPLFSMSKYFSLNVVSDREIDSYERINKDIPTQGSMTDEEYNLKFKTPKIGISLGSTLIEHNDLHSGWQGYNLPVSFFDTNIDPIFPNDDFSSIFNEEEAGYVGQEILFDKIENEKYYFDRSMINNLTFKQYYKYPKKEYYRIINYFDSNYFLTGPYLNGLLPDFPYVEYEEIYTDLIFNLDI